jgi:hypothetical protein
VLLKGEKVVGGYGRYMVGKKALYAHGPPSWTRLEVGFRAGPLIDLYQNSGTGEAD